MSADQLPIIHRPSSLTSADLADIDRAIRLLERPGFAVRLADYAGQPINRVLRLLPARANDGLRAAVNAAIGKCLDMALQSLDPAAKTARPPPKWLATMATGVTGGVSGFFGPAALPIELPLTTTMMLRTIAEIARREGEDLTLVEARLACLEVFALGGRGREAKREIGYYATRAVLTKLTSDAAALLVERGVADASAPIIMRLVGEIASRFGLVVTERVAAGAVPVLGAVGGATINMIFMDHFQTVARGHFAIRRLERRFGAGTVRRRYDEITGRHSSGTS
jgi:hypothetical protein